MALSYTYPVNKLLILGRPGGRFGEWRDYADLGITAEHIPELIRILEDQELLRADSKSFEVFAPVHAWRALGQLKAREAVQPLLALLRELEDEDWLADEIPQVLAMIGPAVIPEIHKFLDDPDIDEWSRVTAADTLKNIGEEYPDYRDTCVQIISEQLRKYPDQDPGTNALLIADLVDLKATESLDLIEKAFAEERVDLAVGGDWEDVQIELGLLEERVTPKRNYILEGMIQKYPDQEDKIREVFDNIESIKKNFLGDEEDESAPDLSKQQAKSKKKRKMAEKSRKKKRRKKK